VRYALALAVALVAALIGALALGLTWLSWPGAMAGGVVIGVAGGVVVLAAWPPKR
jgi:hypothetical protein